MSDISGVASKLRFGGLATGLDTDSIVKQLMNAEKMPLDKLKQNKQLLEWKRDNYREITNLIRVFKDDYFNLMKPSSNMMSTSIYNKFATTSSDSSVVTVTANSDALAGTHKIKVTSLATAANTSSSAVVSKDLTGSGVAALDYTGANNFNITLNGLTKTITLRNGAYADAADLIGNGVDGIQKIVDGVFGAGKVTVTEVAGVLKFTTTNGRISLTNGTTNDALANLSFTSGASNKINLSDTLENLSLSNSLTFDGSNQLDFTINGVNFKIDKTATLSQLMNQINSSQAGVELKYSELTDKFTLTAKQKGSGDNIVIANNGGNLFGAGSPINITDATVSNGTDAVFDLDGTVGITRNDNTFTIDGVTYTLNSTSPTEQTITVGKDVDGIFNNIKAFVDKYNELINKINSELSEERFRDYKPLTDDQKETMKDDEIKKWEEKASSGLLNNDSLLKKITTEMRAALSDPINGVAGVLSDIGISTGNWRDKGKLVIDETKLKNAIQTNPDKVQNFFIKTSSINYSPDLNAADRSTRYNDEGIINRLSDIIQDSIRTTRNANGEKGMLLQKAGLVGDGSEYNNTIYSEIKRKDLDISTLIRKLDKKEENYYKRFAALEKAIGKMNSQSAWLSQQLGSGA